MDAISYKRLQEKPEPFTHQLPFHSSPSKTIKFIAGRCVLSSLWSKSHSSSILCNKPLKLAPPYRNSSIEDTDVLGKYRWGKHTATPFSQRVEKRVTFLWGGAGGYCCTTTFSSFHLLTTKCIFQHWPKATPSHICVLNLKEIMFTCKCSVTQTVFDFTLR